MKKIYENKNCNLSVFAFTLVELLGVIVLLGLLGLLTAPVILNAIEDSKKNTFTFAANTILYQINEYV